MVHTAEGTLQAYLDGEIDDAAERAVADHIAACTACAEELDSLRDADRRLSQALALLDSPAPVLSARAEIARRRSRGSGRRIARLGAWGLAKAAMLLLVLAGAGAAAIPDFRRALETTFSRVVAMLGGDQERTAAAPGEPTAPEPVEDAEAIPGASFVTPADGRVQILLHAPTGAVDVVVRLVDGEQAEVTTATDEPVRRRVGSGRLELIGLGSGTVTIGIPRDVPNATVEIDGVIRVYKEDGALRLSGSDAAGRGSEVRFQAGS